jgi:hypothetical protein
LNNFIEVGISSPKHSSKPVTTALDNADAVRDYFKLAGSAFDHGRFNTESGPDEGHEPRSLRFISGSSRTVDDLNLHFLGCISEGGVKPSESNPESAR